jgi:hypothetical protein
MATTCVDGIFLPIGLSNEAGLSSQLPVGQTRAVENGDFFDPEVG